MRAVHHEQHENVTESSARLTRIFGFAFFELTLAWIATSLSGTEQRGQRWPLEPGEVPQADRPLG